MLAIGGKNGAGGAIVDLQFHPISFFGRGEKKGGIYGQWMRQDAEVRIPPTSLHCGIFLEVDDYG